MASFSARHALSPAAFRRPPPAQILIAWIAGAMPALATSVCFPNYSDPITARPPLPHPPGSGGEPCASVAVVVGAELSGYGQVVRGWFEPPPECAAPWGQVVLDLFGAVAGHQYDRYGAVWFRGVEVLRMTTPEPSPAGIRWHVEKDLGDYASLFSTPGELTMQIPNIVNDEYTGVLHVNLTLSFFTGGWQVPRYHVVPLRDVVALPFPLSGLELRGSSDRQENSVSLARTTTAARLDVYASGHGCEEFWYVNELNGSSCGGGAFRELRVLVDGHLAGAHYPFPVMYTGGLNPLLWRPLTGILSFDIPAYRFDLTPFLGWLTDGQQHNITVHVVGLVPKGFWVVDGVLVLEQGEDEVESGTVDILPSEASVVNETIGNASDDTVVQHMWARTEFHVRGSLQLRSGARSQSAVSGNLRAWSTNTFIGDEEQDMVGSWRATVDATRDGRRRGFDAEYPLKAQVIYRSEEGGYELEATVDASRNVEYIFEDAGPARTPTAAGHAEGAPAAGRIALRNRMRSHAVYNRTQVGNETATHVDTSSSNEFGVSVRPARGNGGDAPITCYRRSLASKDGDVTEDRSFDQCAWLHAPYVCGQELCGAFSGSPVMPVQVVGAHAFAETEAELPATRPWTPTSTADLPDRLLVRLARWSPLGGPGLSEDTGGKRQLAEVDRLSETFV